MNSFVITIAAGAVVVLIAVLILTILLVLGSVLKNLEKWEHAVEAAMQQLDDDVAEKLAASRKGKK